MTLRRGTLIFAGYVLLTLVITHPLVWHLASRVPHDLGDPLLSVIILWWNAHHVPLSAAWWDPPFFWPTPGVMAFSDHRLGESLIASPLQWMGLGPLAAYNITLLAMFPLCAIAMYWLGYTLTRRHDAGIIAGLIYGFSPYRFGHLEHLELLAAFGLPVALAALHRYLDDRRTRWLAVFALALYLQALASSYYFLFFLLLLGLWMVWFVRRGQLDLIAGVAVAGVVVAVAIAPIAWGYMQIHARNGFARGLNDIVELSADVTSIVTAPSTNVLWGWTSSLNGAERQTFPGLTVIVLIAAGIIHALRARGGGSVSESAGGNAEGGGSERPGGSAERGSGRDVSGAGGASAVGDGREARGGGVRQNRVSLILLAIGVVLVAVAASAIWLAPGPGQGGAGAAAGFLSIRKPFKPFSVGFYCLLAAVLCSSWVRDAFRRRSLLAFYVLAAAAMFIFSLGPKPSLFHQQIIYESPYAWLMRLTLFRDGVRVPARFSMLVILSLSSAGAIAYARLTARRGSSVALACLVSAAVIADSWNKPPALLEPPAPWPAQVAKADVSSFVALPYGDTMVNFAAMYQATLNGRPTINGASGYVSRQYGVLLAAFEERDDAVFDAFAFANPKPLLVAVDRAAPGNIENLAWLSASARATKVAESNEFVWFTIQNRPRPGSFVKACGGGELAIASLRDTRGPVDARMLSDGDQNTYWINGEAQRAGDALIVDLGKAAVPCAVMLAMGTRASLYPRRLSVATSEDGATWRKGLNERFAGEAVRAAMEQPRNAVLAMPVPEGPARYIRLRLEADLAKIPWIVTELAVAGSAR